MLYTYLVKEIHEVDGDTLDVTLDLGLDILHRTRIRLNGLNAPEKNTVEGKAAKAYVHDWLSKYKSFEVDTIKDKTEKYGRYLGDVFGFTDDSRLIMTHLNQDLLDTKHALPWDGKGTRPV